MLYPTYTNMMKEHIYWKLFTIACKRVQTRLLKSSSGMYTFEILLAVLFE